MQDLLVLTWRRRLVCVVVVVLMTGLAGASPQSPPRERKGSWAARTAAGATFQGTWTATADPKTGTVTGTWTLDDESGRTLRRGGWSAAKAAKGWNGTWRAIVTGSKAEFSGTWTADVTLEPDTSFADLFELAMKAVARGGWQYGTLSGGWSIRTFN